MRREGKSDFIVQPRPLNNPRFPRRFQSPPFPPSIPRPPYWREAPVNVVTRAVIFCGVFLLFLPKINFVAIEGFRAGLRIDDFVIAGATIYLLMAGLASEVFRVSTLRWGIGFVAASFLSHAIGGHVLFSFRMLEYLSVVVIGYAYGRTVKQDDALAKLLFYYIVTNAILCVLQSAGIVGGIGISGFTNEFGGRAFGLCNGPWELGIVVCIVFGVLVRDPWIDGSAWRKLILYGASALTLVLTAARTPMAIFVVLVLMVMTRSLPPSTRLAVRLGVPVLAWMILYFGVWAIETDNFAVARLREFLNPHNLDDLYSYAVNFRPSVSYVDTSPEELVRYKEAGMDPSMAIRLNIFSFLASSYYFGGPIVWAIGIGHGVAGPSTDMGMVRIFAEVGLLGFACFHLMLASCARALPVTRFAIVAILVNQLTLDVYVGYKTMFVFFLIVGYAFARQRRAASQANIPPPAR